MHDVTLWVWTFYFIAILTAKLKNRRGSTHINIYKTDSVSLKGKKVHHFFILPLCKMNFNICFIFKIKPQYVFTLLYMCPFYLFQDTPLTSGDRTAEENYLGALKLVGMLINANLPFSIKDLQLCELWVTPSGGKFPEIRTCRKWP